MTSQDSASGAGAAGLVRHRHVFYIEGYDPQGAVGYHRLFGRELKRFMATWGVKAEAGDLAIDSDDLAHWMVETQAPNWQVSTRYEFLRLEAVIGANLAQPIVKQVLRALRWAFDDLLTGTTFRIFRASYRFGIHVVYPQLALLLWLALSLAGGALAEAAARKVWDLPLLITVPLGIVTAVAIFAALLPLAVRWFVVRVVNGWPYLREFSRGARSSYDHPVEACARRIVEAARANEAEEILVVGHSAGGVTSLSVMARALTLDPDLGRHGPRVIYLTVGSLMPAFALHPAADRLRAELRRLATEPFVRWLDWSARKDVMNFYDFDPVKGVGIDVGGERHNPLRAFVRLRDCLTPEHYRERRYNYFRLHYQFIMANEQRTDYDYFMIVCGPVAVESWAINGTMARVSFAADGGFSPPRSTVSASA